MCRDLARLYTTSPDGFRLIPTIFPSSSSQSRTVWPHQPATFDSVGHSETASTLLSFEEAVLRLAGLVPLPVWDSGLHQSLTELSKPAASSTSLSALSSPRTVLNMYGCIDNVLYTSDISSTHLRQYLILVLENLSTGPTAGQSSAAAAHQSQRTMLATWIFELYLHDLSKYLLNMQVLINNKDSDLWSLLPPVTSLPPITPSTTPSTTPSAAPAKASTVWDYLTFTPAAKDAPEPPHTSQANKPAASVVAKDANDVKDGSRIDMMLATQNQLNTLEDELKQFLSTYK